MRIRLATPADAEVTRAIYNVEVVEGTATFDLVPRSLGEQRAWLERHRGAHPVVVAVEEPEPGGAVERVLGFGSLSPFRSRPAYATTVEDSVYVDAGARGRGVGRAVLEELVRLARQHGFHSIMARIVSDNVASLALHRACGFELVGVEKEVGRKHGRWLDVVELQRML
ncbi:MAG TPA: GNAT family N-acetyltransferase [Acidimicrobiales bacterium]|nr:GNAT family N-acetyltransferase [Acidimicrobiales bacterium]